MNEQKSLNRRRYRVAMVCDFFYPRLGGVENHIWSLSQELIRCGHKVIIISNSYGERTGVRYMSSFLKVYHCPITPIADQASMPTFLASLPLIRAILIRERIEIVHSHQATSTLANEALVYAGMMGLRTVYTDHSLFGFSDLAGVILNRVLQTTLCNVDAAICVSHACRDNLLLRAKMDGERVFVVPNALNSSCFSPSLRLRHPSRTKIIVISRLVYRKGVDLLVRIIPIVCRQSKTVDFIIGGDGSKMLDLQEMVEREQLQDRVEFKGAVPHAKVPDLLRRGHVFLNCSLTESFCIAILEAASVGLMVVSTNVGGVPEVLPSDMILLAAPNVPELVSQVQKAVSIQQSRDAIDTRVAHERVSEMYSWPRVCTETTLIYDRILQRDTAGFAERAAIHQSLGGVSGIVAVLISLIVEAWYHFVVWYQPSSSIDVVPDLKVSET